MTEIAQKNLLTLLNNSAEPLASRDDYESLLKKIGNAEIVLIGEATHGTAEFYKTRAEITKKLILQKGFNAVAIEGDWPDTYEVNRYLQGHYEKSEWNKGLSHFTDFPTWIWRNDTIPPFLIWLREFNDNCPALSKIGFYGLDLYNMYAAMAAVISYLEKIDTDAAVRARERYACFDFAKVDPQRYGYLTSEGTQKACLQEALDQLHDLEQQKSIYVAKDDIFLADEFFYTTQNARVVKSAEEYYRSLFEDHKKAWNLRDMHMAETLNSLYIHLKMRYQRKPKIVVWAHNSHVGDARATEMGEKGEFNLGQLLKEKYGPAVYSIGFSTYQGTVTAADAWGENPSKKTILPGVKGSYEHLFQQLDFPNFLIDMRQNELEYYLKPPRLQRAIGVIYRPETERLSHYFFTRLPYQFDCVIHFNHTNAVDPLLI